jgi:hypothetical protein
MEQSSASFEGVVDELIAARIVYWMGGPYCALNLRETSRRCARMIPGPAKISDTWEVVKMALIIGDSATCLKALARGDDDRDKVMNRATELAATYDRRDILAFIFDKTKGHAFNHESGAILHAAVAGNLNLCEFIRDCIICSDEWKRGTDAGVRIYPFSRMLCGAARANRCDLFKLALKWIEEYVHSFPDLDESMYRAAESGSLDTCKLAHELAIEHGQTIHVERVLQHAALGGSIDGCKLAREWGARQFGAALFEAAESGSIEMCKFARGWLDEAGRPYNAKVFLSMIMNAARSSKLETLRLAHEWFVAKEKREPNLVEMYTIIAISAERINMETCKFLFGIVRRYESLNPGAETIDSVTEIIDEAMKYAVLRSDMEMCEMLHSWGAVHYEMYLEFADANDIEPKSPEAKRRTAAVRKRVREWMPARAAA